MTPADQSAPCKLEIILRKPTIITDLNAVAQRHLLRVGEFLAVKVFLRRKPVRPIVLHAGTAAQRKVDPLPAMSPAAKRYQDRTMSRPGGTKACISRDDRVRPAANDLLGIDVGVLVRISGLEEIGVKAGVGDWVGQGHRRRHAHLEFKDEWLTARPRRLVCGHIRNGAGCDHGRGRTADGDGKSASQTLARAEEGADEANEASSNATARSEEKQQALGPEPCVVVQIGYANDGLPYNECRERSGKWQ